MHDDFIDEWQKMAKEVEHKEKGNLMFELAKPVVGGCRCACPAALPPSCPALLP